MWSEQSLPGYSSEGAMSGSREGALAGRSGETWANSREEPRAGSRGAAWSGSREGAWTTGREGAWEGTQDVAWADSRARPGQNMVRGNSRTNGDGYLMDSMTAYTPRSAKQAGGSNHHTNMTTFSEAYHTESYNLAEDINHIKPSRTKKTKRLSQFISEAGYKLYGSFTRSHNQIRQQQSHRVPYT